MSILSSHPLCIKARSIYYERFGQDPSVLVFAPGRINLIGEHTDYNHGFVLPSAIEQGIAFAMGEANGNSHTWFAIDTREDFNAPALTTLSGNKGWAGYFAGAYLSAIENFSRRPAIRCVFTSDLPAGAGLSSSSSLTCGFLLGINTLCGLDMSREELAWLAHLSERNFIGLQGGIMDQHACLLSTSDHLLFLDCLDRSFQHIAFPLNTLNLFLINTSVKHKLTESDYNTRAEECRRALQLLQNAMDINTLRELTRDALDAHSRTLGPLLTKRLLFVLEENRRVQDSVDAIHQHSWNDLGALLCESHRGLRDEYEVSCPELDFLFDAVTGAPFVLGARMMGGGFGGCTINLSSEPPDDNFKAEIINRYKQHFGWGCGFIPVKFAGGAEVESV